MPPADIDLERTIYDPDYRRAIIERLNREDREEPARALPLRSRDIEAGSSRTGLDPSPI